MSNEFPVLSAVLSAVGVTAGGFWGAYITLTRYVDGRVEHGMKGCKERIAQAEADIKELTLMIEKCKGASTHFLNIIDLCRTLDDSVARSITTEARKGIEQLK